MTKILKSIWLVAILALAAPLAAQETTETPPPEEGAAGGETGPAADPLALNMGEDPTVAAGTVYVAENSGDWEVRCVRVADATEGPNDPCQLYQLLRDGAGNAVAEINLFPLPAGTAGEAAAGATVVTPLETLLTQQLSIRVDGGSIRRYPFGWCSQVGCFARIGFTEAEIDQFRRGASATVMIVPVTAPDQRVDLTMSLNGFTAGYATLKERAAAAAAAAGGGDGN